MKYAVVGKEVAPTTGMKHLQGYVVMDSNHRLAAMKKLSPTCHWEVARGSHEQNRKYCVKDEDYFETGEMPKARGESEKDRWEVARDCAKRGALDDIPADIYLRYYRTVKEIKKDHMARPSDEVDTTGVWYYGEPGVGKSHLAREKYPNAYMKMQNKWWDGYQDEENVILDDFDSKELGHLLKIWADKYAFLAETKGGALFIRPKTIVITSNYKPDDLWSDAMLAAVKRRFKIVHLLDWRSTRS